jgi:hypothetical protein
MLDFSNNLLFRETKDSKDGASFYARVLYSGHPIRSIHGVLDWIPLSKLIDIMSPYVPEDITSLCG